MKTTKKLLLAGIILMSTIKISISQISFSHSLGASYYAGGQVGAPGIMYSPRINFLELNKELTLSAGTHLGLGLSMNSREGASSFAFDLPIMAEINYGHGAKPKTRSSFGAFGGVGFGISKIGSSGAFSADYNSAVGPVINAGIRCLIKERPLGLRASYLLNTKKEFSDVFSVGLFYTFGDF